MFKILNSLVPLTFPFGFTDNWNAVCPREYYLLLKFIDQLDTVLIFVGEFGIVSYPLCHSLFFLVLLIVGMLFVLLNIIFFFDLLIKGIRAHLRGIV